MNRMMPRDQTLLNGENTGHCGQIVLLGILKKIDILENGKLCGRFWHTWAHVIGAAYFELFAEGVRSGQAEIGDGET